MELQQDEIIIINWRKINFSPLIKKKEWFELNKDALLRDGWRLPTRLHLKQIMKDNDLTPFKAVKETVTKPKKADTKTVTKKKEKEA